MVNTDNKNRILKNLTLQNSLFNPGKSPGKDMDFQFIFNEPEGIYHFYFSIRNKISSVVEGTAPNPAFEIITDFDTWDMIGGKYLSPKNAMKHGSFKIRGNILFFLFKFRKIYSGNINWQLPQDLYKGAYPIQSLKQVLILSCSPRDNRGATSIMVDHLTKGMKKAGAVVEVLYPAKIKINPCIGCFQCWVNGAKECIYHEKDDMKIILEKYHNADLVVWATPVYHYHGTTAMKTVMDRLFINSDPHFIEADGVYRHPRKWKHLPYYAVLAVGGFPKMDIFKPLQSTFRILSSHTGIKIIGELFRHTSMMFLAEDMKMRKKDIVFEALEKAGKELIQYQKISKKTKRSFEQKMLDVPMIVSAVNYNMDIMQKAGKFPFVRNYE